MTKLYHYTDKENLDSILNNGLLVSSRYEEFCDMRKNVVFCWLSPEVLVKGIIKPENIKIYNN